MQTVGISRLLLRLYLFLMIRAVSENCRRKCAGKSSSVPGFVGESYF